MNIQIFKNDQFGDIRVVINERNEPMFCLSDICGVIGLTNPSSVAKRLDDSDKAKIDLGRENQVFGNSLAIYVTEPGFYDVILFSDSPKVKPFRKWVTSEILPSIRKHGAYATETTIEKILNDPEFGIQLLTKLKEEQIKRIKAEKTVSILTHTNKTYTCTEVAKEIGFKSANELNKTLHELGVQYKQNDTWVPYSKYSSMAWFDIKQEVLDNGKIIYHRRITGIGREGIINLISA